MPAIQGPDSRQERLSGLIDRYEKDILRVCYLYLHHREQAQDAVQDTFVKAYTQLDKLRDAAKERSWLMKIAVNVCRDYLRSPWAMRIDRYVQPENLRIASDPINESRAALAEAVMNLPRKEKEALILRYIQGYDLAQTARILGITPSAVSRRCRQARIHLKKELEGSDEHNG